MLKVPLIELRNVTKSFKGRVVLFDINLTVFDNDFITITGPSGVGKTTLLNILSLFENSDEGDYLFNGNKVNFKNSSSIIKNNFGFVFQNYNLLPGYTVKENVCSAFLSTDDKDIDFDNLDKEVIKVLENLNLTNVISEYVENLSGGEKQRVAIGRAIIKKPHIIFADEPTGNLDEDNTKQVLDIFKKLNSDFGIAIVIVTHDPNVSSIGRRRFCIKGNKIDVYEKWY